MKTALDFYERGKLKESNADDYNANSYYSENRFICPECGEPVYIRPSKYANFFIHHKRTDTSIECDRRVDGAPTGSIYEPIGIPIYLKEREKTKFDLYLSCKAISEKNMDIAEENHVIFSVDSKMKYAVTRERFSTDSTVYLQLMHIPSYGQKYTIDITPNDKSHIFYQQWSNYADGFSNEGALFTVAENGGKKIRHGDNVYTETDYYWIRRQGKLPEYIIGIDMKLEGTLDLSEQKWNVFRGKFLMLKEDNTFNFLVSYLREKLEVHLLERKSEFVPLWPPITKCDEGFLVGKKVDQLFGRIVSGNDQPKMYAYSGITPIPQELTCKEGVLKLHFSGIDIFINVDRKYLSTGVLIRAGNKPFISDNQEKPLFIASDGLELSDKTYEMKKDYFELRNADCVEYVLVSQEGKISKKILETKETIYDLKANDRLFFLKHKHLLAAVKIVLDSVTTKALDEQKIIDCIKKYMSVNMVNLPPKLRCKMDSVDWNKSEVKKYVEEVLKINRISIPMKKVMEEAINEISRP